METHEDGGFDGGFGGKERECNVDNGKSVVQLLSSLSPVMLTTITGNRRFHQGLHMEEQTIEQLNARSPKKEHSILVLLLDQARGPSVKLPQARKNDVGGECPDLLAPRVCRISYLYPRISILLSDGNPHRPWRCFPVY